MPGPSTGDAFTAERARLVGLAYRVTGSRAEAEDIVQDAWIRWQRADPTTIERPAAWLTTVTGRLALDRLKAARRTREAYVGPWLPDAVATGPGPEDRAVLAESLTFGFLAVLERLGPVERVVFLLADVFDVPFDEIAAVVGRSPTACRQVATRARRHVREERPRFVPTDEEAWRVTRAFLTAAGSGDLDAIAELLTDDAVLVSDGGADHHAARRPVHGARIARFLATVAGRVPPDAEYVACEVNGQPGVIVRVGGAPFVGLAVDVVDGRVRRVWAVVNPEKLAWLDAAPMS